MGKNLLEELDEMFNIPLVKKEEEEDAGNTTGDIVYDDVASDVSSSFENKTKLLVSGLDDIDEDTAVVLQVSKAKTAESSEYLIKQAVTESIPKEINDEQDQEKKDVLDEEKNEFLDDKSDDKEEYEESKDKSKGDFLDGDENVFVVQNGTKTVMWNFKSPDNSLNKFYAAKESVVSRIVGNNLLPFESLLKELRGYKVDIKHDSSYDPNVTFGKLRHVHALRERVKEIQLDCNSQYYRFDDAYEMLRGLLLYSAQKDFKPVAKFEGYVYIHLGDVREYRSELVTLHKSTDLCSRTLDSAYDCLSRKITIIQSLLQKDPERREGSFNRLVKYGDNKSQGGAIAKQDEESKSTSGSLEFLDSIGDTENQTDDTSDKEDNSQKISRVNWKKMSK